LSHDIAAASRKSVLIISWPPDGQLRYKEAMANSRHVSVARHGALAIAEWKQIHPGKKLDLSGADLSVCDLAGANLAEANLDGAKFTGANLKGADLYRTSAAETNFRQADLRLARVRGTSMSNSDLRGAKLIGATLRTVEFDAAQMNGALFGGTIISAVDLSRIRGLEATRHQRPSSIGIDTIVRSRGRIAPEFLRAAGVPEALVKYVIGLSRDALAFYSCFISYTEKDNRLSQRLYRDLEARGVRCWRWREDSKWGHPLQTDINRALEDHEKVIVILSQHSLEAKPVLYEIEETIRREEKSRHAVLFPVRVDDAIFAWKHPLQKLILTKHLANFTGWTARGGYHQAFKRLLRDLRAEEKCGN
jgi:hypothetical protein